MSPPNRRTELPRAMYEWPADRQWDLRVRCEDCRYYVPNRLNPSAGIGSCEQGLIGRYPYPGALHYCRTFKARNP